MQKDFKCIIRRGISRVFGLFFSGDKKAAEEATRSVELVFKDKGPGAIGWNI
jgi:hypothetical protein